MSSPLTRNKQPAHEGNKQPAAPVASKPMIRFVVIQNTGCIMYHTRLITPRSTACQQRQQEWALVPFFAVDDKDGDALSVLSAASAILVLVPQRFATPQNQSPPPIRMHSLADRDATSAPRRSQRAVCPFRRVRDRDTVVFRSFSPRWFPRRL
jgi:hypothetical protein